jgi:UDP-3-O-[3-hydroxymyristoyl] N-acetylglucosamine deacetylase/3-hydroxyacyl-[acyl-carrier-protein] dehydratase
MSNTVVKQRTLQSEVTLKGIGLHTGKEVTLTFKPAAENHGYAFSRVDVEGNPVIQAKAEFVTETQRGTNLEPLCFQDLFLFAFP